MATVGVKSLFVILVMITSSMVMGCSHSTTKTAVDDEVNIYFARHGKTIFNTYDLVQGWADSPLTEQGIKVAKDLGEGFKDIDFDAYYTSDAGRQRETMQIILAQKGVTNYHINELKGLREVFFGGFEGGPNKKVITASMKLAGFNSYNEYNKQYQVGKLSIDKMINSIASVDAKHEAENYQQVKARTQAALDTIVKQALKNHQKNILAISSGMSMQTMISDLTDNIDKNKPLANASVVKIIYKNGQYQVTEIGNLDYINKGKAALKH